MYFKLESLSKQTKKLNIIISSNVITTTNNIEYSMLLQASLVAQMVKNLSTMQETQVGSLGWEDPLEKGTATHYSTLAWKISRTGSLASYRP